MGAFDEGADFFVGNFDAANVFFIPLQCDGGGREADRGQVAADGPFVDGADLGRVAVDAGRLVLAGLQHGFGGQGQVAGGEGPC